MDRLETCFSVAQLNRVCSLRKTNNLGKDPQILILYCPWFIITSWGSEASLVQSVGVLEWQIWRWKKIDHTGQIIATSHDLTPKGSYGREIHLSQGNLGWWNIIIWFTQFFSKTLGSLFRNYWENHVNSKNQWRNGSDFMIYTYTKLRKITPKTSCSHQALLSLDVPVKEAVMRGPKVEDPGRFQECPSSFLGVLMWCYV